jgi:ABC-2 type transport system permease protein
VLWQWAAVPRSLSAVFAHKTLLITLSAIVAALPATLFALRRPAAPEASLLALLHATTSVAALALFQSARWLRRADPATAPSSLTRWLGKLLVLLFGAVMGVFLLLPLSPIALVPPLLTAATFAAAYWHTAAERLPFALDPSADKPPTLTANDAFFIILLMSFVQQFFLGTQFAHGTISSPAARAWGFALGTSLVVGASLAWLRLCSVTHLREKLAWGPGRGMRLAVREGVLWGVVACGLNLGYARLSRPLLLPSTPLPQSPVGPLLPLLSVLAGSPVLLFFTTVLVAPIVEELVYRGMLHRVLRTRWRVPLSTLVSAALFASNHAPYNLIPVLAVGVCITLALERSRSLLAAIITHALNNGVIALLTIYLGGGR